jgi:M6 family metalloprotease-like protein
MVHIDPSRGSVQRARDFTESVGSMCHEYGHVLGLNDLYDIDFVPDADPASDAAGIGDWGLMGWGGDGWHGDDGPAGMSAYSRWMLGWARIVDVASQRENLRLPAVGLAGDLIAFLWPRANSSSSSTGRQARRTTTATCLAAAC